MLVSEVPRSGTACRNPSDFTNGSGDQIHRNEPSRGQRGSQREALERQLHAECVDETFFVEPSHDLADVLASRGAQPNTIACWRLVRADLLAQTIERDALVARSVERAKDVSGQLQSVIRVHI